MLVMLGLASPAVIAMPAPDASIDARDKPWEAWKRAAVEGETPEMMMKHRDTNLAGSTRAG